MESGLASLTHLFFHKAGDKAQRHDMLFSSFAAELRTITLIIRSLFFLKTSVCALCVRVWVCTCVYHQECLKRPDEGIRSSGPGDPGRLLTSAPPGLWELNSLSFFAWAVSVLDTESPL